MQLLTVTGNGFGKRTPFEEYPRHHRGGSGVVTHETTSKTGPVVAARTVHDMQELMIISQGGIVLRTRMDSIRLAGRATQGVTVMDVSPGEAVASISCIDVGQAPATAAGGGGEKKTPGKRGDGGKGSRQGASRGKAKSEAPAKGRARAAKAPAGSKAKRKSSPPKGRGPRR